MSNTNTGALNISELDAAFVFRRRPIAIPGDLRPSWKIGLIVLLLSKCCRQNRTSLTRLHVLSWAFRTTESLDALRQTIAGSLPPDSLVVRFEPSLNRAVDFALGERLVTRIDGSRIELAPLGKQLADEINSDESLFVTEKLFMAEIRQKVSEAMIDNIFGVRS